LYYRLNVLPIRLPPLRERLGDLDALSDNLLDDICRRAGLAHRCLAADALELLARHRWPGNIRELRNVLEQACLMGDETLLRAEHLLGLVQRGGAPHRRTEDRQADSGAEVGDSAWRPTLAPATSAVAAALKPLPMAVAELEIASIRAALVATQGNKLAAAKVLGIARATLYEKMATLGLRGTD
jgi:DNA-binding NtrC family response regulator